MSRALEDKPLRRLLVRERLKALVQIRPLAPPGFQERYDGMWAVAVTERRAAVRVQAQTHASNP